MLTMVKSVVVSGEIVAAAGAGYAVGAALNRDLSC
jgi:hypothetical protein